MDASSPHYTVLARRFRPQTFSEVVGQTHVAQALKNAITGGRVAHAYLFTGARGVGKTSMARILAKALNCPNASDADPCNLCDICQGIASGHDVDVLEIDGASNRRIDDIRLLRSNVGVKPMRARYKIYIIDEVHMLTNEAFNALLKTLEEPPANVKFVFCTTEPNKVPDTILSRCQRFDFAPIATQQIVERLHEIAAAEGYQAEPAALELVARRSGGSMRDSQSLFDQLLAYGGKSITARDVHRLLGTASDERLIEIADGLIRPAARPRAAAVRLCFGGGRAAWRIGRPDFRLSPRPDGDRGGGGVDRAFERGLDPSTNADGASSALGAADDCGRAAALGGNQDADAAFGARPRTGRIGACPFDASRGDDRPGDTGRRTSFHARRQRAELKPALGSSVAPRQTSVVRSVPDPVRSALQKRREPKWTRIALPLNPGEETGVLVTTHFAAAA